MKGCEIVRNLFLYKKYIILHTTIKKVLEEKYAGRFSGRI